MNKRIGSAAALPSGMEVDVKKTASTSRRRLASEKRHVTSANLPTPLPCD